MSDAENDNLQLKIPSALKRELAMDAAKKGVTIRSLILSALAAAGYEIADEELRDKRKGRS
ncbi:hypothetical protein [Rhizobium ecuadorense]|uniref:hypothetical protein n=1 Tax=Rhizobium ecuadorense TaxID=1671795 RepID=UPI0006734933|nr:hypothetical protein [Rhizobium ecuadorense]